MQTERGYAIINKNAEFSGEIGGFFQMINEERVTCLMPMAELERDKIHLREHYNMKGTILHDHAFLELTYITRGTVEHTLDGQMTELHEGDYLIVDYGSRHFYRCKFPQGYDNVDCLFLPEIVDPVLKGTKSLRTLLEHYLLHFNMQAFVQNPARMVFHDCDGRILELIRRLRREELERGAGYIEFMRCYLLEILLHTMRQLDDAQAAAAGDDVCGFITEYVREHYMEPLTLQALAKRLNYSLPYLSKKFKDDTGVSFVTYLQNYRVMEGCRLLSGSNRTLAEITEMVGYHDVKFFSELVKRFTGLSPRKFRRKQRPEG